MTEEAVTQRIGELRTQIRRYLVKELAAEALNQFLRALGLDIALKAEGSYEFRVPLPQGDLTEPQRQTIEEMPKLHAVDPPETVGRLLVIKGYDVECLPAMLTELTQVRLISLEGSCGCGGS